MRFTNWKVDIQVQRRGKAPRVGRSIFCFLHSIFSIIGFDTIFLQVSSNTCEPRISSASNSKSLTEID